jgi:UMP-CMP kinase
MRAVEWAGGKYLIDGFPRSQDNLDGWNTVLGDSVTVEFCLFFDVSEKVMTARLQAAKLAEPFYPVDAIYQQFVTFRTESLPPSRSSAKLACSWT